MALRRMDRASLGTLAPPAAAGTPSGYVLQAVGDGFQWTFTNTQTPDATPLHLSLAFGSGKTGMTYVALSGADTLTETRWSYFPRLHQWYPIPGQETMRDRALGKPRQGEEARQCVLCHAATLPSGSLLPEKRFLGVGCESCHGPGGAHVAAIRSGHVADLHIDTMDHGNPVQVNDLCGKCHVTSVSDDMRDQTHRFQAYGLMQSACFTQGRAKISCLTCHDPHTDASRNVKTYEAACLSCHSAHRAADTARTAAGKPCPVNAGSGCIGCHMPRRKTFLNTSIPATMVDHYIHVPMT